MQALSTNPRPEEIMAGMGTRFFVSETGQHSGSSPITAELYK
jgi:hypothetical protein